jgi:hypothetical protein
MDDDRADVRAPPVAGSSQQSDGSAKRLGIAHPPSPHFAG